MSLLIKKVLNKLKDIDIKITTGQETKTNEIINGKRVYKKRINVGYLETGYKEILHGITGWQDIVKIEGIFYNENTKTTFTIPRSYPSDNERYGIDIVIGATTVQITCGTNYNGATFIGIVTIYYTKN